VRKHPELEEGYRTLVHRFLLYANLPWAVMGAGIMFGFVPTVFHYLNPRNGAFVTVWYITIAVLGVSTTHWIFLRDGAEALIRHPDC
jgi:hypothetical protein